MEIKSLRKIAQDGMKGRKKSKRILFSIITMTFLFIVLATTIMSSMEESKRLLRIALYGGWEGAVLGGAEHDLELLLKNNQIDKLGSITILGESEHAGIIGAADDNFFSLSGFELEEGRLPETEDEIALESTQLGKFGRDISVGDTVMVEFTKQVTKYNKVDFEYFYTETWIGLEALRDILRTEYNFLEMELELLKKWAETPEENIFSGSEAAFSENEVIFSENEIIFSENNVAFLKLKWDSNLLIIELRDELIDGKAKKVVLCQRGNNNTEPFSFSFGELAQIVRETDESDGRMYRENVAKEIEGVNVTVRSVYISNGYLPTPQEIVRDGMLIDQMMIIRKEYVVTGIINSYNGKWNIDSVQLPNAFLSSAGGEKIREVFFGQDMADLSIFEFPMQFYFTVKGVMESEIKKISESFVEERQLLENLSEKSAKEKITENSKYIAVDVNRDSIITIKDNTYTYPPASNTEDIVSYTLIGAIFAATIFAVLQVFLTQVKRRRRYIALLKCIAYSNRQICSMLMYEVIYVLKIAAPVGIVSGFALSILATSILSKPLGYELYFYVQIPMLLLGFVCGLAAVFLGAMIPMFLAMKTPLTGALIKAPKHKKLKENRKQAENKKQKINLKKSQSFFTISMRYYQVNKGKAAMNLGLVTLSAVLLLFSLFLSYQSFLPYQKEKNTGVPDITYHIPYTMGKSKLDPFLEKVKSVSGVIGIEEQKKGLRLQLSYQTLSDCVPFETLYQNLPQGQKGMYYTQETGLKNGKLEGGFYTNLYTVDTNTSRYQAFLNSITQGSVDTEKFEKGEEVIVLLPMYSYSNTIDYNASALEQLDEEEKTAIQLLRQQGFHFTYEKRYKDSYKQDTCIKIGDTIRLKAVSEKIDSVELKINEIEREKEVKVAGIISYFPEENIWPFSAANEGHIILSSNALVTSLYPYMGGIGNEEPQNVVSMIKAYDFIRYGETDFFITLEKNADLAQIDRTLAEEAGINMASVYNHRTELLPIYQKAIGKSLLTILLGSSIAVLLGLILYNISVSRIEQERVRIGVLQAIGITRKQFILLYLGEGLIFAFFALAEADLLLFFTTVFTTKGLGVEVSILQWIKDYFIYRLDGFWWNFFFLIHIGFLMVMAVISYLPIKQITKQMPIQNIREMED